MNTPAFVSAVLFITCAQAPDEGQISASKKPALGIFYKQGGPAHLVVWYVMDNGSGERGFASVDDRSSLERPGGSGLFATIEELREAIEKEPLVVKVVTRYGGKIPEGWKLRRDLTPQELKYLNEAVQGRRR
jgi:hypothetical protein